jgi:NTE family protein
VFLSLLVLSGGASLAAIQVGMLRALYELRVAPDVIVGTSAGELNGAFIADRRDRRRVGQVWRASGAARYS